MHLSSSDYSCTVLWWLENTSLLMYFFCIHFNCYFIMARALRFDYMLPITKFYSSINCFFSSLFARSFINTFDTNIYIAAVFSPFFLQCAHTSLRKKFVVNYHRFDRFCKMEFFNLLRQQENVHKFMEFTTNRWIECSSIGVSHFYSVSNDSPCCLHRFLLFIHTLSNNTISKQSIESVYLSQSCTYVSKLSLWIDR